jgi:DNA transformation protein and related proteins
MASLPTPAFVEHCRELLSAIGMVRSKRMFGGWGFYVDGLFLALMANERLYLKVDDSTQARFAAVGCEPFSYDGYGKPVTMRYWTVPAKALESPALMQPWARLAMQAALNAAAAKAPVKPKRVKAPVAKKKRASRSSGV